MAEGGFSKAKSHDWSVTQVNAHLGAGGTVSVKTGKDATFAGAVVTGNDIMLDIGRNLTVQSRQDVAHGSSSSVNGSGSVTIGVIGRSSLSVSGGMGRGSSDIAWVSEQSGLFARSELDIRVEKHTQIDGAVLSSDTNSLRLDTGTLGYSDILDHDKGTSIDINAGVTIGSGTPGVNVSGAYAMHDIEQTTKATVGGGEIIIRNEDKQKQDVAALNRDVNESQVITKDEREGVKFYASSGAVGEILSGFAGIQDNVAKSANSLGHLDQLALEAFGAGKSLVGVLGLMLERVKEPALAQALTGGELSPVDALKQLRSACGPGRQGFNLHDLLFTPAYADGCTLTTLSGETIHISDVKSCAEVLVSALVGQAYGLSWNAGEFSAGIKNGLLQQGQDFVELASDPVGLARSLGGLVADLVSDPKGTAKALGVAAVSDLQEKAFKYLEALDKGDYQAAGALLSGLAVDAIVKVAAPAAGTVWGALKASEKIKVLAGAFRRVEKRSENVWELNNDMARGLAIEKNLASTEYIDWYHVGAERNGFFELVDFQKGNTLVSVKSVDTTGSTWLSRMEKHIVELNARRGTVNGAPAEMVLDLRVQPGGAAAAQALVEYGIRRNVTVKIKVYP